MRPDQARALNEVLADEAIGSAIAKIRQIAGRQNQAIFAAALGLTREQVAFIETGRTPINLELGWLICKKFNVHPAWLISGGMEEVPLKFDAIPSWKIAFLETRMRGNSKILFRQFWRMLGWVVMEENLHTGIVQKLNLTYESISFKPDAVKDPWLKLKKEIQKATTDSGTKSALAKFLGVDLTQLSKWLTDSDLAREPGAGYTLKMLHWVEQQERQK